MKNNQSEEIMLAEHQEENANHGNDHNEMNENHSENGHQESSQEVHREETHHGADAHAEETHGGHGDGEQTVVQKIVADLGDHREFTAFNYPLFELPVILYDEGNFKFYSGIHSMEEAGEYTYHHHKIVKAKDHEAKPTLDLSITNFLAFQIIAAIILVFLFSKAKAAYKKNPKSAPKGIQNVVEMFVMFIRDDIARSNIPVRKLADSLTPYLITLFFFIYTMNMIGLVPGGHTPTGSISITAGLALTSFFVINFFQIKQEGIWGYIKHLGAGAPIGVNLLMFVIEFAGQFIKPAVLAIRLFANMSAGHIVLFSFIGLIIQNGLGGTPFSLMALFVYLLELLVAFIQAYIFTLLTAIFLGLGLHGDHEHAH